MRPPRDFGFGGRGPPEQKQEHTDPSGLFAAAFGLGPRPASTGPAPVFHPQVQREPNLGGSNLGGMDEMNRRLAAALAARQQSQQQAEAARAQEVAEKRAREAPLQNAPTGAAARGSGRGLGRGKRQKPDQQVAVAHDIAPMSPQINRADMSRMQQARAERDEDAYQRQLRLEELYGVPYDTALKNRMQYFPQHPDFKKWEEQLNEYEPVSSPWEVDDLVNQWTNNDAHRNDTVAYTSNHPGSGVW